MNKTLVNPIVLNMHTASIHRSQPKLSMGKDLIFQNVGNVVGNRDTLSKYSTRYSSTQTHDILK